MKKGQPLLCDQNGFSLYELMAVIVVIMILTAIAAPIYSQSMQTCDRVDEANIRILNSFTLHWLLADEANDPLAETIGSLHTKLQSVYVSDWPKSPNSKVYERESGQWVIK